jgi:hypothetical protein
MGRDSVFAAGAGAVCSAVISAALTEEAAPRARRRASVCTERITDLLRDFSGNLKYFFNIIVICVETVPNGL